LNNIKISYTNNVYNLQCEWPYIKNLKKVMKLYIEINKTVFMISQEFAELKYPKILCLKKLEKIVS